MSTIESIPVELRQQIISHLDTKSFKAFRLKNHQLDRGTFSDLLKRSSREKHVRFTIAELEKTIRLLEDKTFRAIINTIVFDPCKHELPSSRHWLTFWTLLAKIRSTCESSRPVKVRISNKYVGRYDKLRSSLAQEIYNLEGCIRYIVITECYNFRTGSESEDVKFFARPYRIEFDHSIATPRKKQTLMWDAENGRLTLLHANDVLLSLVIPWIMRSDAIVVKDLRIYHSTLDPTSLNVLTGNVTKVILEDVDILMLPYSKSRCRWRSILCGMIQRSEQSLLSSCQLSQLCRSWPSCDRHSRRSPDEESMVMKRFAVVADTSSEVQEGLEAIVREDVLER